MAQKRKALLLFSGGLDSLLAAKLLEQQKIPFSLIAFQSYFFTAEQAQRGAKQLKKKLIIKDISAKHWQIVKKPRFGYGQAMNPCRDCHLLMLKEAKKMLSAENALFLATGEVLNQRPFSQTKKDFQLLEKQARLERKILRPLSAKALPPTIWEEKGIVDRAALFGWQGKSRRPQIKLAKKFKLSYPSPAGGCLLTDPQFSQRLKTLLGQQKRITAYDLKLLKLGRFFTEKNIHSYPQPTSQPFQIIVGRCQKENKEIEKIALPNQILLELKDIPGPLTLIKKPSRPSSTLISLAAWLTKYYTPAARTQKNLAVKCWTKRQGKVKIIKI